MFDQNLVSEAKTALAEAKSVAILLPPEPTTDMVASALGLFLSLKEAGKVAQIGCGSPIKVENADLFGVDQIKNSIGNQNLIISFDFKEEDLKKVDYDVDENGKFMLLIQPQPGSPAPDTSSIAYSYSGASADLVFVFSITSLEELGKIYADEKAFLDHAKIISLSLSSKPSNFSALALHSHTAGCLAEIVTFLLQSSEIKPSADAANNLLSVISENTRNFSSAKVTAETFETVAYLMRAGGRLGRSPLAASSRFGAFPPANSAFGGSPFGGAPFMGGEEPMPPMFDDELPPPPDFNLPPRQPRPTMSGRPNQVGNDWKKKPQIFKGGNRGISQN